MWKMFVLNNDKEASPCTKRAMNNWLKYLLAEGMKTFKHTVHSVEVTHHTISLCVCCLKMLISIRLNILNRLLHCVETEVYNCLLKSCLLGIK